jgi:ATP-dependent helicase/nuclease subunit A
VSKERKTPTLEQRQAADPAHSAWVAASAGSGKTQVLVDRVIRLMLAGAAPECILCLTFTKAAAAEMAGRLFERLSKWIAMADDPLTEELRDLGVQPIDQKTRADARKLFAKALETPGGLKIQTIHAFCERLLQLFPVESGMAPGFRVMEEQEADQLFRDALLQSLSTDNTATQSAWAFLNNGDVNTLAALEKLAQPFLSTSKGMRQRLSSMTKIAETEAQLRETLNIASDRTTAELKDEITAIHVAAYEKAARLLMPLEADAQHCAPRFLSLALHAKRQDEKLQALADLVLTGEGAPRKSILRKAAGKAEPGAAAWLEGERHRLLALFEDLAKLEILEANLAIYRAMAGVVARVNIEKRARGLYDFDDLIARTAQLLHSHEAAQWVLYKLDRGLSHILVDEAQDTSPAQWTVIQALAGEFFTGDSDRPTPRTVFAVGDIKQSIFGFQGADISAFETARLGFEQALRYADQDLRKVDLTLSYRSAQAVLDAVDETFAMDAPARQGFGPRASTERPHTAFYNQRPGRVELWQVELKPDVEERDNWQAPVDTPPASHPRLVLAERIASAIHGWVGKRKRTRNNDTVKAGDILILVQRRNALFNALIGALRRRGVPVAGADRLKLQQSLIVQDLIMLGQVLRLSRDDHALACVLKSPLVPEPVSEETLFTLAHGRNNESLWNRLSDESVNKRMLKRLMASQDSPFLLFSGVLQQSCRTILERLGPEAEDAAQEFLNLALDYELLNGVSLSGFLDWLQAGETEIKREMEHGGGEVRIMTTHGAKGLEAPIVFLADAADVPRPHQGNLITVTEGDQKGLQVFVPDTRMQVPVIEDLKQQQRLLAIAERMRLLYVGMTRAADELYICGSHNKETDKGIPQDSWYPQVAAAFETALAQKSEMIELQDGFTIRRFGVAPVAVDTAAPAAVPKVDLPDWALTPLSPSVRPIDGLVAARDSDAFDKAAVARGVAMHRLIEVMADVPEAERLHVGQRWAARLKLDIAIVDSLAAQLASPDLSHFFAPDAQSEVSIEGEVRGLGRVSGRIDRLRIAEDAIFLLDYKTNRHPPATLSPRHPYARQMARYAALLREAYPNREVNVALLWTETGEVMWLPQDLLSQALDVVGKEMA